MILIVDDRPDLRQALSFVLTAAGYANETAADGRAALRAARTHAPDLFLVDWHLEGEPSGGTC